MATKSSITKTAATAVPTARSVGQLSFTSRRADDGVNLWSPGEVADDRAEQCRVGRDYGCEAVNYIRETGDAAMLPGIVRAIVGRGTFSGVEVGFFSTVSMGLTH